MKTVLFAIFINVGRGVEPGAAISQEFYTEQACNSAKERLVSEMRGQWERARVWCQPAGIDPGIFPEIEDVR